MRQTLEQKRAAYALGRVEDYRKTGNKTAAKYKSLVKGFSAMVLHNGLGQSVAFLLSKAKEEEGGDNEHAWLISDLSGWLVNNEVRKIYVEDRVTSRETLISKIINGERKDYIIATEEALLLTNWLAKFGNALIEDVKEKEDANTDT